ncbi:pyrimidine dimer DNA glycosylase/endonuclease V [Kytococcus sedentarius]|uniref:pyrimidine dimer DNA glycosylase/endonuclease V n=1 Tax=Kytococcus sedentarius TaxID=1276 RepID=UPI00384E9CE0
MRLWSVHPAQLDRAALVAGWREGLLAQKVLRGLTKGYTQHPQLERFRAMDDPVQAVATWLHGLADEADERGYSFDRTRVVVGPDPALRMPLTDGQLHLEWEHLATKVRVRNPEWWAQVGAQRPRPHPLFVVEPGPVEHWERAV